MPVYFEYALKVSLCLTIFFLFYTLFLKRMTYYTWNRYFLLIFPILSFIVPFINVNVFVRSQQLDDLLFVNQIPTIENRKISLNLVNNAEAFSYWQILSAAYILVSATLFIRLFVQLLSIQKIYRHNHLFIFFNKVNNFFQFFWFQFFLCNKEIHHVLIRIIKVILHKTLHKLLLIFLG